MPTMWYRVEVEDNDSGYDFEAVFEVGMDACELNGNPDFKVTIECEDADA